MGAQFVQVLRDHAAKDQHRTEVNQYMKVGFIEQLFGVDEQVAGPGHSPALLTCPGR